MSRLAKNVFKKVILAGCLLLGVKAVHATDVAYTGVFQGTEGPAKVTGQTAAATYTRDMNTTGDRISIQVVSSTFTGTGITSQTFTDGSTSTGTITVSSNSFVQSSTPTIKINGVNIVYIPQATSSATAQNISNAIIANSSLNTIIVSTWTGTTTGVVSATSTLVGVAANFTMTTSSQAALGVSNPTMTGGTNSAFTINTPTITIASNGFTTGLQVLYSTPTTAISGLVGGTTYYISVINPNTVGTSNSFKLASSLANAQAGTGIVLTSSQTKTTADTYTLAPLTFANTTGGIQLQWSDDKVTFFNATTGNWAAAISSVTFASGGTNALWDLGPIQHRYLRLNETPPTAGAVNYTVTDNERYSFKH